MTQPVSLGQAAAATSAARWIAIPTAIVGRGPNRSAQYPTSGDSAYMPTTCRLIVSPTIATVPPLCMRCTGVIVMIDTITTWLSRIAITA